MHLYAVLQVSYACQVFRFGDALSFDLSSCPASSLRSFTAEMSAVQCRGLLWVLKCLLDIVYGVEYMHFNGVLHGDLKCANVLCKACSTDIRGFVCKVSLPSSSNALRMQATWKLLSEP